MQKDFITVTPDSGNGDSIITVITPTNSEVTRNTTLIISGGGITKTIEVSQATGLVPNSPGSYNLTITDGYREASVSYVQESIFTVSGSNATLTLKLYIQIWNESQSDYINAKEIVVNYEGIDNMGGYIAKTSSFVDGYGIRRTSNSVASGGVMVNDKFEDYTVTFINLTDPSTGKKENYKIKLNGNKS